MTGAKSIEMENQTGTVESLIERLRNYGETRLELIKLKAINKSSGFVSVLVTYLVLVIILIMEKEWAKNNLLNYMTPILPQRKTELAWDLLTHKT